MKKNEFAGGVEDLSLQEMEETRGGFLQVLAAFAAVGAGVALVNGIYELGKKIGRESYYMHH
jgi:hypothetical protein